MVTRVADKDPTLYVRLPSGARVTRAEWGKGMRQTKEQRKNGICMPNRAMRRAEDRADRAKRRRDAR